VSTDPATPSVPETSNTESTATEATAPGSTATEATAPESTAARYERFAASEARGESAVYAGWATGVAGDAELLAAIDELPPQRRQPALLFAVSRLVGAPVGDFGPWREFVLDHWPLVRAEALVRLTQTNEPLRCAALMPVLAAIPGPIALLEVGSSAGLCLYPDRFSYRYDGAEPLHPVDGPSAVLLECATNGLLPPPERLPQIVWRSGIDLAPLDVASDDDSRWLETLIWPEQTARLARLRAAMAIARADPPLLVAGDVSEALPGLAAQAPAGASLVVVSSGVLVYVVRAERERFVRAVDALDARWLSLEAAGLFPSVVSGLESATGLIHEQLRGRFALALDGDPLAFVAPHGDRIDWLPRG
jgi:hypothetical protein